jgi:hypothetical protein
MPWDEPPDRVEEVEFSDKLKRIWYGRCWRDGRRSEQHGESFQVVLNGLNATEGSNLTLDLPVPGSRRSGVCTWRGRLTSHELPEKVELEPI